VNLNSAIEELLSILHRLIGEDIELLWSPGSDLWSVLIDPAQINQVLTNLAVSARDSIDKNGIIAIETRNVSLNESDCAVNQECIPGEYVVLSLSDNRCGMEKDVVDHLFEPFFTTKKVGEGAGLGMPTVYGIVRQNNGFISIDSKPGKGTMIRIYFPRCQSPAATVKQGCKLEPSPKGSESILLVEDEQSVLILTRRMLERLGYSVLSAATPKEAIEIAQNHSGEIDLLLVDVIMPEMTGRELSEILIRLRPKVKRLFMSGYTADIIAQRGVLDPGIHFIQKPFSSKELACKVREAIDN
jgi:CheY-like chemotaxis protein